MHKNLITSQHSAKGPLETCRPCFQRRWTHRPNSAHHTITSSRPLVQSLSLGAGRPGSVHNLALASLNNNGDPPVPITHNSGKECSLPAIIKVFPIPASTIANKGRLERRRGSVVGFHQHDFIRVCVWERGCSIERTHVKQLPKLANPTKTGKRSATWGGFGTCSCQTKRVRERET